MYSSSSSSSTTTTTSTPTPTTTSSSSMGGAAAAAAAAAAAEPLPACTLHQHALAHLELQLLLDKALSVTPATCDPPAINACMQMLRSVAARASAMAEDGHSVAHFEEHCSTVRQHLHSASEGRALAIAEQFTLPMGSSSSSSMGVASLADELRSYRLPEGAMPAALSPSLQEGGLEAARRRAAENLG